MGISKELLNKNSLSFFIEDDSCSDDYANIQSLNKCIVNNLDSPINIYNFIYASINHLHKISNLNFHVDLSVWDNHTKVVESFGLVIGYTQQYVADIFKKKNKPFTDELSDKVITVVENFRQEIYDSINYFDSRSIELLKSETNKNVYDLFIESINVNLVDTTDLDVGEIDFAEKQFEIRSSIDSKIKNLSYFHRFGIGYSSVSDEIPLYDNKILQESYGSIYDTHIDSSNFKNLYTIIDDIMEMYDNAIQLVNGAENLDFLRRIADGSEIVSLKESF